MRIDEETRKAGVMAGEKTIVGSLKAIKNLEDVHFARARSQLRAVGRHRASLLNVAQTDLEPKRVIGS